MRFFTFVATARDSGDKIVSRYGGRCIVGGHANPGFLLMQINARTPADYHQKYQDLPQRRKACPYSSRRDGSPKTP